MLEVKKFSASWCGPCKTLAPTFNEVKNSFSGISFNEYDVDDNSDIASQFGIRSVPTVLLVKDGKEVKRIVGAQAKNIYESAINENLG
jgi:thioredoxin 1